MGFVTTKGITRTLALLVCVTIAPAQTLAKKNWANSGMTIAPWWQSPVLYQIDPVSFQDSNGDGFGDLAGIAQRLDYLQALNIDALVLSPVQTSAATATQPFDPAYGTPEDLDQLVTEASRHKIRIFVDLPLASAKPTSETVNIARFWLSRGIAGLRLTIPGGDLITSTQLADRVRELRKLAAGYPGDRVLFWDVLQPAPSSETQPSPRSRHSRRSSYSTSHTASASASIPDSIQMALNPALELLQRVDPQTLRQALTALPQLTPTRTAVLPTDGPDHPRSFDRSGDSPHDFDLARILATALLTSPGAPLLYFGQEIGMQTTPAHSAQGNPTPMQWGDDRGFTAGVPWMGMGRNTATANAAVEDTDRYSLLNWYRRLTALHRTSSVLREGFADLLNLSDPSVVAWVRRPRAAQGTASPVVVLCNLSDHPAVLSLAPELRRLNVNAGTGVMHTLATSETPSTTAPDDPANDAPVSINTVKIPPYGVYIGELRVQAGLESMPSPRRSRRSTKGR